MGLNFSNNVKNPDPKLDCALKFERILDAEYQVYLGIGSYIKDKSLQVIRIGDHKNKYHRLTNFTEKDNKLKYEFENDIILVLKGITLNNLICFFFFSSSSSLILSLSFLI